MDEVFVFLLCALALLLLYRLIAMALGRRRPCGHTEPDPAPDPTDEVQMMQQIQRGLTRMEQRLDALETLLGDRVEEKKAPAGEHRP